MRTTLWAARAGTRRITRLGFDIGMALAKAAEIEYTESIRALLGARSGRSPSGSTHGVNSIEAW